VSLSQRFVGYVADGTKYTDWVGLKHRGALNGVTFMLLELQESTDFCSSISRFL
jgi:hypothetical protein